MSKYKVGDKVVMKIISADQDEIKTYSVSGVDNNWRWCLPQNLLERYTEPLSTYTEPLEAKIQKQSAEILKQKEIIDKLLNENEKLMFKIDAYELYGDQHKEEYNQAFNQGAEAAWELARKIVIQNGYSSHDLYEIFESNDLQLVLEEYTYQEAAAKVAEWEKAKKEIKVGDVLEDIIDNNIKCIVTKPHSKNKAYLIFSDGSAGLNELNNLRKTGHHTDIDSFLKQIGEEQE